MGGIGKGIVTSAKRYSTLNLQTSIGFLSTSDDVLQILRNNLGVFTICFFNSSTLPCKTQLSSTFVLISVLFQKTNFGKIYRF